MGEISLEKLNEKAAEYIKTVVEAEDGYYKRIAEAVLCIEKSGAKIVLLAGPSGAGKTTTANILKDRLIAVGYKAFVVSLDNFYLNANDPHYPVLPTGKQDMESVYALNLDDVNSTLKKIISGDKTDIPIYDFVTASRSNEVYTVDTDSNSIVIIEGLHALNPEIGKGLPQSKLFKIFLSVSTNINYNGERILSGKKIRFLRRLSRDYIYRALRPKERCRFGKACLTAKINIFTRIKILPILSLTPFICLSRAY